MSTSATSIMAGNSDVEESSMASNLMDVATAKRDSLRQALESIHSQSNSLLLFSLQWKDLEDYFTSISDAIAKRMEETELKSQQIEWRRKYLTQKSREIELKEKRLEESLKMADDRLREIDVTYELVERCYGVVKRREKRFDYELERMREKEARLNKYKHHLKRKFEKEELKLEAGELRIDNLDYEFNARKEKLGFTERGLLQRLEEVELKEKRFDERVSELERREKMLEVKLKKGNLRVGNDVKVKIEPECDDGDGILVDPSYADIKINVTMDGRALQMFLNGRVNDHETLRDEISTGLRLSSDPAKLVLDAILGFYPEELENADVGFDLNVIRKSCILLLEELSKMKPRIKTRVRERAMKVAMQWKGKMNVGDVDHYLEVVGFLWLVATYGLTYEFDKDELLLLFEGCACHNQAPELCRGLGLTDDIHGVIQNLVIRDQPFEAMRLIYAFELVEMFPPAPILKAHLASTIAHAEQLYKGNPSIEAEIKCISMKLAALVSVVKSIKEYGLECNYPVQPLEDLISELKMQKRKCKAPISASMAQENTDIQKLCITSAATPISSSVKESTSLPVTQICLESTGPKSPHSSTPTNTEPITPSISDDSYSLNSYGNCVSPSLASPMISPESVVNPEHHTSKVGSPSSPKVHPRNMTQQNKRPRLASVITSGRGLGPSNQHMLPYASRPTYMVSTMRGQDGYYVQRYYPYC